MGDYKDVVGENYFKSESPKLVQCEELLSPSANQRVLLCNFAESGKTRGRNSLPKLNFVCYQVRFDDEVVHC